MNQRAPRPLGRIPNSTPLRLMAVTRPLPGTPWAASRLAFEAAMERFRKKWLLLSRNARILERLARQCSALALRVASRRGIGVRVEPVSRTGPARLARRMQEAIESAAGQLGLRTHRMPSGAGHDAQNLATLTEAGMIFIPSTGGRSHRPDEASDPRAIERGANVLLHTLLRLPSSPLTGLRVL